MHLYNCMKDSRVLNWEIKHFEHAVEGHPEHTYDYLMAGLQKHINETRRKREIN